MKNLNVFKLLFLLSCLLPMSLSADTIERTGSRISGSGAPRYVLQLDEPAEIRTIRSYLRNGQTDSALALAKDYVAFVEESSMENTTRHHAYDALCVAYTSKGEYEAAIENCNHAIALNATRWGVWNNRGTIYLLQKNYDQALEDYQYALGLIGRGQQSATETVRHNIELTESRRND